MDALSDVLRIVRLTGGVFLHGEFFDPWCLVLQLKPKYCEPYIGPASHMILYHYVVEGRINVRLPGRESVELVSGEVVLFPHNDLHLMGSHLNLPPVPATEVIVPSGQGLYTARLGGNGTRTRVICGFLACDSVEGNPVISTLPPILRLNIEETTTAAWIRATFQYAAQEVTAGRPGSKTVLAKLSELLFVDSVRRYVESLPSEQTGWLAGLRDPYVARALALFHGNVARAWTVDELGREVGLSRSSLADRFTRLIGQAPMQYLSNWRMQVAAHELRNTSASIAQIAGRIGYDSEAAFSRTFKKAFGIPPVTWRQRGKETSSLDQDAALPGEPRRESAE